MYEDKVNLSLKWPLYGDKSLNCMQTGGNPSHGNCVVIYTAAVKLHISFQLHMNAVVAIVVV